MEIGEKNGATAIKRSDLACDESLSPANFMIEDFLKRIPQDFDLIVWAHCTNPFLYARHYDDAINLYLDNRKKYDSLLSVYKVKNHMWDHVGEPMNYDPWTERHTLASALPPVYYQNGGIFVQPFEQMKSNKYFFGSKPIFQEHNEHQGFDINTEEDLAIAASLVDHFDGLEEFQSYTLKPAVCNVIPVLRPAHKFLKTVSL